MFNFYGIATNLILLAMAAPISCGVETWRAIGPFGGSAAAVVADPANPDRLLAISREGLLFLSENSGEIWKAVPFPHELTTLVHAMVVVPGEPATYYVALAEPNPARCSLYRSRDGGTEWEAVGDLCKVEVFALAPFRGDPQVVAAGGHNGVYLTRDGGRTWKAISPAQNRELQPVMSLAIDPTDSRIIYAGTPHLPWRTMDGGRTWGSVHRGMIDDSDVFSLEVDGKNPKHVLASACSGIYASQDRGANWTKLAGIPRDSRRTYTIRLDPGDPAVIYAGTSRGLWKSVNSGLSWKQVSPLVVKAIAFDPSDSRRFLMATERTGLVVTTDGGNTTRTVNSGFGARRLSYLQGGPAGLLTSMLYEGNETGIYRYNHERNSWESVTLRHGASLNILSLAAIDRLTFLATTYDGIRKSMDGGRSWFAVGGPWGRARVRSLSILPGDPAVILAGTDAGVFRSENGGEIWELVTAKPVSVEAVYATARPGSTTLALTSDGLFFSSDRGRGWTRAEKPYGTDLYDVALHRENFILAATSRGLYRSTDQAKTWQLVKGTLGTGTVRAVCIHPTKSLAFAAQQSTVYMTADGGSTWSALPSRGLERCLVQALVINPETPDWLYALAKGRGVFALPLTDASARR